MVGKVQHKSVDAWVHTLASSIMWMSLSVIEPDVYSHNLTSHI